MFTASSPGTHIFTFNSYIGATCRISKVAVYLNGNIVEYFNHDDDQEEGAHRRDLGRFWAMDLEANDEIYLSNLSGDYLHR